MVRDENINDNKLRRTYLMKTKKSDFVVGVIITAIGVVLVGLFVMWLTGFFKGKKADMDESAGKIDNQISSVSDFDLTVYDGAPIQGDVLKELMDDLKEKGVQLSVGVVTLDGTTTYYNYAFTPATEALGAVVTVTPPAGKATNGYITPSGNFVGDIIRNANDEIVCITFTQQK
jgi:hypothetical protein